MHRAISPSSHSPPVLLPKSPIPIPKFSPPPPLRPQKSSLPASVAVFSRSKQPALSATQCRFVVVEPAAPQPSPGAIVEPPPRGAGRRCRLLVEPSASAATNHLVHGHFLGSRGCCSSAPLHLFSWCAGYTLLWDINNVPLPLLQLLWDDEALHLCEYTQVAGISSFCIVQTVLLCANEAI